VCLTSWGLSAHRSQIGRHIQIPDSAPSKPEIQLVVNDTKSGEKFPLYLTRELFKVASPVLHEMCRSEENGVEVSQEAQLLDFDQLIRDSRYLVLFLSGKILRQSRVYWHSPLAAYATLPFPSALSTTTAS